MPSTHGSAAGNPRHPPVPKRFRHPFLRARCHLYSSLFLCFQHPSSLKNHGHPHCSNQDWVSTSVDIEDFLSLKASDVELILADLSSVVRCNMRYGPIQLLHASLGDFLHDKKRSKQFYINGYTQHLELVLLCFKSMQNRSKAYLRGSSSWYSLLIFLLSDASSTILRYAPIEVWLSTAQKRL